MKIAILSSGMVGNALGTKLVQVGHEVTMGSRSANNEAAMKWAASLGERAHTATFRVATAFGEKRERRSALGEMVSKTSWLEADGRRRLSHHRQRLAGLFKGEKPGLHHYCYSIANYDPADAVARLKAAGLAPKRRGGRVYFDDPDGIECQVAGASLLQRLTPQGCVPERVTFPA